MAWSLWSDPFGRTTITNDLTLENIENIIIPIIKFMVKVFYLIYFKENVNYEYAF